MRSFRILALASSMWLLVSLLVTGPNWWFVPGGLRLFWLLTGVLLIVSAGVQALRASGASTATHDDRVVQSLLLLTVATAVYPLVFSLGYFYSWWRDPPGVAWIMYLVTLFAGSAMALVCAVATARSAFSPSVRSADAATVVPSLGRLLVSVVILAIGLPLAALAGAGAGLAGFSCSGGAMGEGCGGGSVIAGVLTGGFVALLVGGMAWVVTRDRMTSR